jgi:hypothetical protein
MDISPLEKLVAYILLTQHPDHHRKALSISASSNTAPPPGTPLKQIIRTVETRGADLLTAMLKQERTRVSGSGVGRSDSDGAASAAAAEKDDDDDDSGDDDQELSHDDEDGSDDNDDDGQQEQQQQQERRRAKTGPLRLRDVWPRDEEPDAWVPRVVQRLIQIGAVVNENSGLENKHPLIRLTQAAYAAAYNALIAQRASSNSGSIAATEVERRAKKKQSQRSRNSKRKKRAEARAATRHERTAKKIANVKHLKRQHKRQHARK